MKVKFQIEKEPGTNKIKYPDDRKHFKHVEVEGDYLVAEYDGAEALPEHDLVSQTLTQQAFRDLFHNHEKKKIRDAVKINAALKVFLIDQVDLSDPEVAASIQSLEDMGVIGNGRAAAILSGGA